jgi:hypothetical protein
VINQDFLTLSGYPSKERDFICIITHL